MKLSARVSKCAAGARGLCVRHLWPDLRQLDRLYRPAGAGPVLAAAVFAKRRLTLSLARVSSSLKPPRRRAGVQAE